MGRENINPLYHPEVCWFSHGKVLQRAVELENAAFLPQKASAPGVLSSSARTSSCHGCDVSSTQALTSIALKPRQPNFLTH